MRIAARVLVTLMTTVVVSLAPVANGQAEQPPAPGAVQF